MLLLHPDYVLQQLEDPQYYFCLPLAYWEKKMQKNTWVLAGAKSSDLLKITAPGLADTICLDTPGVLLYL